MLGGNVALPVAAGERSVARETSLLYASGLLASLVPRGAVVSATFDELAAPLFPDELKRIRYAVPSRVDEYRTVRTCARAAMAGLGVGPAPLVAGSCGEPLWPSAIVGSLTHCDGYRAAAVALRDRVGYLGIDAEPNLPLPAGVASAVMGSAEAEQLDRLWARGAGVAWDRLVFSAKESIYKAWFPLTGTWLGFEDVHLSLDPARGAFEARVAERIARPERAPIRFEGRYTTEAGLIVTAVGCLLNT